MKVDKSRELYERSKKSMAGGVGSSVRMSERPVPLFFQRAKGSHLYDVDGNDYIDYVLGQGPDVLGHSPDFLLEAVARGMQDGQILSGQHEVEISVSEMVQKIVPSAELVRYANSGTEVVQAALRVARAYTGRNKFIKFEGQFHGWMDSVFYSHAPSLEDAGDYDSPTTVPSSAGMALGTADEVIVLPWNNIEVLRNALDRHHNEIAAIITEPIMCNTNSIFPRHGYMEEVRRLCDERGIVLIFDEVITGFRVAPGGAQELLGITPDLSTFAKAIAGGFPLSVLAGKEDIMGLIADGTVWHGGTANSNLISMSAAEATLNKLMEDDGAVYKHMYAIGTTLMEGLREIARKHEIEVLIQGPASAFCMVFTDASEITDYRSHRSNADREKYGNFVEGMLEHGVRLMERGMWFMSAAHTEEDVKKTLAAADEVFAML